MRATTRPRLAARPPDQVPRSRWPATCRASERTDSCVSCRNGATAWYNCRLIAWLARVAGSAPPPYHAPPSRTSSGSTECISHAGSNPTTRLQIRPARRWWSRGNQPTSPGWSPSPDERHQATRRRPGPRLPPGRRLLTRRQCVNSTQWTVHRPAPPYPRKPHVIFGGPPYHAAMMPAMYGQGTR